jgi:hypothetical protein
MVIGTTDGRLDLEISVYHQTSEGSVFFHIPDQGGRLFRVDFSDGVFGYPLSELDGTTPEGRPQNAAVLGEHFRVSLCAQLVQEPRRPRDVGKHQRDFSGREITRHR